MMDRVAWVAATIIGLALGGFILHFPGSFGGLTGWDPVAVVFGGLLGFANGVLVGILQWAGLRLPRGPGGRLLLAMGVGVGVTHALNDGAPFSLGLPIVAAASGLAMTAATAGILHERRPVALVANFAGWAGGLVLADLITNWMGLPCEETPVGWSTEHLVDGVVVGLIWGVVIVAVGLPEILRRPSTEGPRTGS